MNFQRSRPLLLVGAAMIASAALVVTPASAQQRSSGQASANCALGAGRDCEDTFGAARSAAASRAKAPTASQYKAYVEYKERQQRGLNMALTKAAEQGREGILKRCNTVSPNQRPTICP